MCLSVCIIYSLLVLTSCSEFHEKVFSNLVRLCPGQYAPTDNGTLLSQTSEFGSCCTDIFKDSTHVEFDSNETLPGEDERTCLFPRTDFRSDSQTERSFYMIIHQPKDGCLLPESHTAATPNDLYEPTCNDSEVIPFMKLLPVSSTSNDLIYKNPHCASCHGQYDVTFWQPYATCPLTNAFSHDPEECDFNFVYPGDYEDIGNLECFTDKFNACPSGPSVLRTKIPPGSDLSVDEIAMACSMAGLPRFAHKYVAKNVFCYLCHYNTRANRFPITECSDPTVADTGRSPGSSRLVRLIDKSLIQQIGGSKSRHPPGKTVCELNGNTKVCHQVLCPLGQLMELDEQAGEIKCQMESTQWVTQMFGLFLMLQFGDNIHGNDNVIKKMFTSDQNQNPWRKSWTIVSVHRPVFEYDTMMMDTKHFSIPHVYNISNGHEMDSFGHALVQLSYKRRSVATTTIMKQIQDTMTQPWYMKKDGKTYEAKQSFSRYSLRYVDASIGQKDRMRFIAPLGQLSETVLSQKRWLYKTAYENVKIRTDVYVLSKLHMCQQVALASDNFNVTVLQDDPIALYNYRTGSTLFDEEFLRITGLNGESLFRICVSDTGIKSTSNGQCRLSQDDILLLFVVVFFISRYFII